MVKVSISSPKKVSVVVGYTVLSTLMGIPISSDMCMNFFRVVRHGHGPTNKTSSKTCTHPGAFSLSSTIQCTAELKFSNRLNE